MIIQGTHERLIREGTDKPHIGHVGLSFAKGVPSWGHILISSYGFIEAYLEAYLADFIEALQLALSTPLESLSY
ncbi:hypothetical protein Krac_8374 [Ktedonobacter racemifer DSM 44963]|uniref:Uncharacterized protein n=1 Tax=Ktedonobacter racemifer DSM 44963 TaxID=485913 RepID=D6TMQ3_KTERA|nr:hypothetical protein Krac_8374 [Ktedonobacter racemifer DSM 44963]